METKNEKIQCDKSCKSFRDGGGFCPHVLVVAEKIEKLRSLMDSYKKSSNKLGNINANLPKQLGGKPNQEKKTKKRKKQCEPGTSPVRGRLFRHDGTKTHEVNQILPK